jgi:hypothetical protein
VILRGHGSNSSASPAPPGAGRARHPDTQHRADDLINQGIRLHGLSTWRTDRQDFGSRIKQIKALAFKGVRYLFLTVTNRVTCALEGSPASSAGASRAARST